MTDEARLQGALAAGPRLTPFEPTWLCRVELAGRPEASIVHVSMTPFENVSADGAPVTKGGDVLTIEP